MSNDGVLSSKKVNFPGREVPQTGIEREDYRMITKSLMEEHRTTITHEKAAVTNMVCGVPRALRIFRTWIQLSECKKKV
ncbi:hypothetical protein KIN20_031923 [Parelaphostrongylus tenuis]|uniref:Uncharacterized protein n=1 Tax=Parelaphostrongylus tenuis TaxID=148309 RepID=A0AAD5WH46_PARTN|nr:hypothetical protein KIN20_031923 [Parelaphostrongylus tenuis]